MWDILKHSDLGGVTTGKCEIGWFGRELGVCSPSSVHRTVKGILKFNLGGELTSPPHKGLASLEIQIPVSDLGDVFTVPSAYSSSGWVTRRLAGIELSQCLDMPPEIGRIFAISYNLHPHKYQNVLRLPPVKIIQCVASRMSHELTNNTPLPTA